MYDDKLWKVFSLFVRLRDADENGIITCITSGQRVHWREADAGHFISRNHKATKFDERNVWAQSRKDNRFNSGRQYEMGLAIDAKLGKGTSEKILIASRQVCKRGRFEIDELTKYYKKEAQNLAKLKGIVI